MLNLAGCHNSGKPSAVVSEFKNYVKNSKATYDNQKRPRRRTDTLRETSRRTDGSHTSIIVAERLAERVPLLAPKYLILSQWIPILVPNRDLKQILSSDSTNPFRGS